MTSEALAGEKVITTYYTRFYRSEVHRMNRVVSGDFSPLNLVRGTFMVFVTNFYVGAIQNKKQHNLLTLSCDISALRSKTTA